jgi:hypothetical protein
LTLVAIALAVVARTTTSFAVGVLLYVFVGGIAYAAFRRSCFHDRARGGLDQSAVLSSFGNIPVIYMTSFDGWRTSFRHSRHALDGSVGRNCVRVVLGLVAVAWMRRRPAVE